eukprot:Clim_evm3s227 gene=Clim_evmTU3s227
MNAANTEPGPRSLFSLQILLYFHSPLLLVLMIAETGFFIFKGTQLAYSASNFAAEVILVAFLLGLELFRIRLAKQGNLTERTVPLGIAILLVAPAGFGFVYLMFFQTDVLRIEFIYVAILLGMLGMEALFSLFAFLSFHRRI